jgi:serine/threonine protein kinase/tetratricopeptide (TPR) repeat protein
MTCPICGSPVSSGFCRRCNVPNSSDETVLAGTFRAPSEPEATHILPSGQTFDADLTIAAASHLPDPPSKPLAARDDVTRLSGTTPGVVKSTDPATGPLELGESFGSRYHIIRLLGLGGMGAVYQAWDAELGVAVALKVVRPEVSADPHTARMMEKRFKQELLLARQVTHKNVVRIHDLGEVDGIKYITMPFIEGEDLATILKREGKLPVARALTIARGVVAGLCAAHRAEVVHRDLKPANIMIGADDEALIMDFGIARSSGRGQPQVPAALGKSFAGAATAAETVVGSIVGTVEYMAPEQARGRPADQRADIYAFGLILYDMLIGGRRSERAESAIAELQGRMQQAPPAPRTVDPTVPEALNALTVRCLEPDPAKRFQTTLELQAALERLDDHGKPVPIIRRLTRRTMAAAAVIVLLLLGGTFYLTKWLWTTPKEPDPVTVVIADFQNTTSDPAFDNTLGQSVKRGLESASFISAFDRTRIRSTFGVPPPEKFDEVAARQLAVKQGVGVVLAGSISSRGAGYDITVQATQPLTGNVIASFTRRASSKAQVLDEVTRVVTSVRKALGDTTSSSAQLLAMKSLSTTSLEVASHYAAAVEAQSMGKWEDAQARFAKAVELDPTFGLGYQGLAVTSRNLGRLQDAEKYATESLRYLDHMTERERFATRGYYYLRAGDYPQCVTEYGEMVARYPADVIAHIQRAGCLARLRNMRGALDEMRQVVGMLPNQPLFRLNLAVYLNYAGEFAEAEREMQALQAQNARTIGTLAFALLGQGRRPEAAESYRKLTTMGAWGASFGTAGLGDLAAYEGRISDAVRLLEEGAAADLAAKNRDGAAMKFTALGYAHLARGQAEAAAAAAEQALEHSNVASVRFLAARIFVETGRVTRARTLADGFASQLAAEHQAYGKIIEGDIALKKKDPRTAIKLLTDANGILDTWLGHFDLGRAYFEGGAFPQADSEFDRCIQRRGEALALVLEDPTYSQFPAVYYYQGRVREELKTAGFADAYRQYLEIRGGSTEDPLAAEVRKRLGH